MRSDRCSLEVEEFQEHEAGRFDVICGDQVVNETPINRSELWLWYVARIRALSGAPVSQVRLAALLGWTDRLINKAVATARISMNSMNVPDEIVDSYCEFLAGEILARSALDLDLPETIELPGLSVLIKEDSLHRSP